jgi:hypothetical protein
MLGICAWLEQWKTERICLLKEVIHLVRARHNSAAPPSVRMMLPRIDELVLELVVAREALYEAATPWAPISEKCGMA